MAYLLHIMVWRSAIMVWQSAIMESWLLDIMESQWPITEAITSNLLTMEPSWGTTVVTLATAVAITMAVMVEVITECVTEPDQRNISEYKKIELYVSIINQ